MAGYEVDGTRTLLFSDLAVVNPIPQKGTWGINLDKSALKDIGVYGIQKNDIFYVRLEAFYYDRILKKQFETSFFWLRNKNGELVELGPNQLRQVHIFISEEKDECIVSPKKLMSMILGDSD